MNCITRYITLPSIGPYQKKSELKAIVGEASHKDLTTIEQVLNREEIGRKRLYYNNSQGKLCEVFYLSPPLKYNLLSGLPEEHPQINHLMVRLLDGRVRMQASEVMEMIEKIYYDSYVPVAGDFSNKFAFEQAEHFFKGYLANIKSELAQAQGGEVFLLSANDREQR